MSLKVVIDALISKGIEVQLKFKGDLNPQPLGPGKITKWSEEHSSVYVFHMAAMMQADKHSQPHKIVLPIVFDVGDVLWVSEGPINADGEKAIAVPSGKRTGGGIVIPGS